MFAQYLRMLVTRMIFAVLLATIAVSGICAQTSPAYSSGTSTGSSTASCKPRAPVGYAWNGELQNGVWYLYMVGPTNFPLRNLTNSIEMDTGIGWLYDDGGTYAQSTIGSMRADEPPYDCMSTYVLQNTTCTGFMHGIRVVNDNGMPVISMYTFFKMYMDTNLVYVRTYCFPPEDTLTTEKCSSPGVSVWTRKMPKDVTPLEDRIIRDMLDDRLQMYCLTSADLMNAPWKYDLPTCGNVERPQAFLDELRYYQENLVKKCKSKDMGYSCTPASIY